MSRDLLAQGGFNDGFNKTESVAVTNSLPLGEKGIFFFLADMILLLFSFVAVLALAAIIWGGIMYILSLGDESRTASAKKIIFYAVIGLILAGAAFAIVDLVSDIFTASP